MMGVKSMPKMTLVAKGLFGACLLLSAASTPAMAQSTKKRVEALEGQVAQLEAAATAASATGPRLDQLEAEIRRLTGQVETLQFQLNQANARVDSLTAVLAGEPLEPGAGPFGDGGFGTGAAVGGPVSLTGSGAPAGAPQTQAADSQAVAGVPAPNIELPLDPEAAFTYANNLVLARDFARAESAFKLYLATFGTHPRAADAQFRLGEIYLATGKNAEAADAFIAHIKAYPNHSRAAEAYLKLGTSFSRLGQTDQACNVFRTMNSKYPSAPVDVSDRARREMQAAGCR